MADSTTMRNDADLKLVYRGGFGFVVLTEVYIDYPENTA